MTPEIEKLQDDLKASQEGEKTALDLASKLEESNVSLQEENATLKSENEMLKAEIEKLLETPDTKEKASGVGSTFTYEEDKYMILVPAITIPGMGKVTALEILVNEEAQKILVEKQSGVIRKLS